MTFTLNITSTIPFEISYYEPVAQIPTSGNENITIYGLFDFTTTLVSYPNFTLSVYIGGSPCISVAYNVSTIFCLAPQGVGYLNTIYAEVSEPSRGFFKSATAPVTFSYRPPNITAISPYPSQRRSGVQ